MAGIWECISWEQNPGKKVQKEQRLHLAGKASTFHSDPEQSSKVVKGMLKAEARGRGRGTSLFPSGLADFSAQRTERRLTGRHGDGSSG